MNAKLYFNYFEYLAEDAFGQVQLDVNAFLKEEIYVKDNAYFYHNMF